MNVVYFRVLMIMISLLASHDETGLFATSFQVFAVLFSLPLLVLSSALPLLSVAGRDDGERLRFGLQRMTEVVARRRRRDRARDRRAGSDAGPAPRRQPVRPLRRPSSRSRPSR